MKHSLRTMLLAASMLCFVSSCIKEDRSECNPGVLLRHDYSLNTEYTNLFGKEVGKVTVYVFDEKGLYYDTYTEEGKHLTNDYQLLLPLPVGNYTTVTWGGPLNTYQAGEANADETAFQSELKKGVTHIDNFMLTAEKGGQPLVQLDALYHGRADVTSVYWPSEATTVNLIKNTKHLTVTVEDSEIAGENTRSGAPYEVYCTGTNGRYLADNSFGKKAQTVINLPYRNFTEPGKAISQLNLLRLVIGHPFRLTVKDPATGNTLFDKDLVQTMLETGQYKTQEDFDRELEYNVVITKDEDKVIYITINGWAVVEIEPEL